MAEYGRYGSIRMQHMRSMALFPYAAFALRMKTDEEVLSPGLRTIIDEVSNNGFVH